VAAPFYQYTEFLGADQPFYFLEPPQLEVDRPQPHLFRDLAERYVEEIRPIRSQGPYLLAGFCSGGAIAMEMALALERRGEAVGALILIDTVLPTHARWSRLIRSIASPIRRRLAGETPRTWPTRKLSLRSAARAPWRRWGWRLPRPLHYDSFEDAVFDQRGWAPEPFGGSAVLIRSDLARRMARPGWGVDADLGWGRIVGEGVTIRDISGTHWDFRHQPEAVRAVALELRRLIDEALRTTASSRES
jgi:thioesterase domain-containing protein